MSDKKVKGREGKRDRRNTRRGLEIRGRGDRKMGLGVL